jgi:hypothetical protein
MHAIFTFLLFQFELYTFESYLSNFSEPYIRSKYKTHVKFHFDMIHAFVIEDMIHAFVIEAVGVARTNQ